MVQQLGNIAHLIAASGVGITVDDVVVVVPEDHGAAVGEHNSPDSCLWSLDHSR